MSTPKFRMPFDSVFRLTQGFGERPDVYRRFGIPGHNGLDWSMKVGTPVLAVDSGKVVSINDTPDGFGHHVKLEHDWGQSLYAHLDAIEVKLDQSVQAGEKIAMSGNSGYSLGPHLHFGLRISPYDDNDGWHGYTNPQRFLTWPEAGDLPADPELERQLQETQQALTEAGQKFAFERQELTQQADLWREAVTDLLRRYVPGKLPANVDLLAALETLIAGWAEDLKRARK